MTAIMEPNWVSAKAKADGVRKANADLRRTLKPLHMNQALYVAAEVLESPTPEQGALPLYRLLKMVPRFREDKIRAMIQRAEVKTWDRRLRDLTERQRVAIAVQLQDYAEGYWRG